MIKTFKIEGDLDANARTLIALELGTIESRKIGNNLFILTIFDVREGFHHILEKCGLRVIGVVER